MIKVLFLSLEKPHDKLFQKIEQALGKVTSAAISCKIVDTSHLTDIRSFYRLDREKVAFADVMLRTFRPNIVVVANDHGINATFVAFCKLKGIPTLAVQDGILSNLSTAKPLDKALMKNKALLWRIVSLAIYNRFFLRISLNIGWPARRVCWGTTPIDRIAVMGERYKKIFVDRGVHPSRIVVTGYPLLDEAPCYAPGLHKTDLAKKIGLDANKPLVLLTTQPFVEDGLWTPNLRGFFIKSVIDSLGSDRFQLVIKLHPRESLYMDSSGRQGVFITRDMPLEELLPASDIVTTVGSTTGLWALAYGKPLVVLTCFPCGISGNVLEDIGTTVDDIRDLPSTFTRVLKDRTSKANCLHHLEKALHDHVYRLDGKASERIAKLILVMAKKKALGDVGAVRSARDYSSALSASIFRGN